MDSAFKQIDSVKYVANRSKAICDLAKKKFSKFYNYTVNVYYSEEYRAFKCLVDNNVMLEDAYNSVDDVNDVDTRMSYLCLLANNGVTKSSLYNLAGNVYYSDELRALKCLITKGYRNGDLFSQALEVNDVSNRADVLCGLPSKR